MIDPRLQYPAYIKWVCCAYTLIKKKKEYKIIPCDKARDMVGMELTIHCVDKARKKVNKKKNTALETSDKTKRFVVKL